jgi:hypothetical protein
LYTFSEKTWDMKKGIEKIQTYMKRNKIPQK